MTERRTVKMTQAEFEAKGIELFGPDKAQWRFVCPVCRHVAKVSDWQAAGASPGEIAFSCVGRHIDGSRAAFEENGEGPCTYAGGGLFRLNPMEVEGDSYFAFDGLTAASRDEAQS